jgi:hypothetical protein
MSELSQDSLLREIDEDIRREKFAKLWKRFGVYVIAGAVLLVAAVAGYQVWRVWMQDRREQAAVQFTQAVALAGSDRAGAEQALTSIARDGPAGYAMLAAFQQAALLATGGDTAAARAAYQELQRTADDRIYRDLAVVLDALTALQEEGLPIDAEAVAARLQPLTADDNPWRFTARELTAVLAWRSGDIGRARSGLTGLTADPQAPADVRSRAQQVLAQLGEG